MTSLPQPARPASAAGRPPSAAGPTRLKVRGSGADHSNVDQPEIAPARRSFFAAIGEFLDERSPAFLVVIIVVLIGAGAVGKALTGPNVAASSFLFLPIAIAVWHLSRRAGVVTVLACSAIAFAADVAKLGLGPITYWNGFGRTLMFTMFLVPLAMLRRTVNEQQVRLDQDEEIAASLRELNEVKDALLHAVSHDLKQPVSGILGAVQTLRRGAALQLTDEECRDLYVMIEASGRRMNRLINDLLDLDRIDRGAFEAVREPTDVGALARSVVAESPNLINNPVDIKADPVFVDIDRGKVERILDNLLANAGRHTPKGTPVHVGVHALSNGVVLTIEDEGPGVPDASKEVLFELFRQGENKASGGLGVGLSLVRRFAELHGGRAFVEDRPGGGARFVVLLPGAVTPMEELEELTAEIEPELTPAFESETASA